MRTSVRVAVTLCLVAVAIFAGFHLWQYYMLTPWTRDARIRADVVVISPDVSGWVRELKAYDNQQVKAGDLLLSIDRDRFEAALEKAQAVVQTRQQQLNLREREASRRASLGPQAISAELRENAQINAGIARGELREAQAEAKMAQINLDRSQVHAPRNGHITNLRLAEGNYVNAGQSVMALIDDSTFCAGVFRRNQTAADSRRRSGEGLVDERRGGVAGTCGEHQPRDYRSQYNA
jgi:RND family efflux transporter MFP subunit